MPFTNEQKSVAVGLMREYLAAPKIKGEGITPKERSEARDKERVSLIERTLKPLIQDFLAGKIGLDHFKPQLDGINKRENRWGFKGIKGQMFFNLLFSGATDRTKLVQELNVAILLPENEDVARSRIKDFASYTRRIGEQIIENGGSKASRPKLGSIPFFLSYFWQVQDRHQWPVYYTNSVQVMTDCNLWSPREDLADDYIEFKHIQEELAKIFTQESGRQFDLYDVEHVFWVKGGNPFADKDTEDGGEKKKPPLPPGTHVRESRVLTVAKNIGEDMSAEDNVPHKDDDDGSLEFDALLESEEALGVQMNRRTVLTEQGDPEVDSLLRKHQDGRLNIQPLFQRKFVWDQTKSSRLMESALLKIPLPVIYLSQDEDGTEQVIDGQQRLTAFFSFIGGKFPNQTEFRLKNLKVFTELQGKRFADLDKGAQEKIRFCKIRTITFLPGSDTELKFEVFERLNTGSVSLNDQELRNCMFRGLYNDLLKRLAENVEFRHLLNLTRPDTRMKDVELVLRFAAFYHATYLKYQPPMRAFMNGDMKQHQQVGQAAAEELETAFKTAVSLTRSMLDQQAFKRFYRGTENEHDGRWEPNKFNSSLYDILMWSMARSDKNLVMKHLDAVREAFIDLMANDDKFIESIQLSTSSAQAVQARFRMWDDRLRAILESSVPQQRCFTSALKHEMFDRNATCEICGNRIQGVDDAALDHVKQYWMGGETIPTNARLTHRYCNLARSRRD